MVVFERGVIIDVEGLNGLSVVVLMISVEVKVDEVWVLGEAVWGLLLDFPFVVASLVGAAVDFVEGVVLEETVEGVWIVTRVGEFGLTVDVDIKLGVTVLVVMVDCECFDVVMNGVENLVVGFDTVDTVGLAELGDDDRGLLVEVSVMIGVTDDPWLVIGGWVDFSADVVIWTLEEEFDVLDVVDSVGRDVVITEFDTSDSLVAVGDNVKGVIGTLWEDAVCTDVAEDSEDFIGVDGSWLADGSWVVKGLVGVFLVGCSADVWVTWEVIEGEEEDGLADTSAFVEEITVGVWSLLEVLGGPLVVTVDVENVDSDTPMVVTIAEDVNWSCVGEDIIVVVGSWLVDWSWVVLITISVVSVGCSGDVWLTWDVIEGDAEGGLADNFVTVEVITVVVW